MTSCMVVTLDQIGDAVDIALPNIESDIDYRYSPEGQILLASKEKAMRKLLVFFGTMLISASALAFHCPADMKKIDDALAANPKLSAEQLSEVKKLRTEGESLHKANKHQESVDTLVKAMKILGI
jgi:hypothetical protein